MARLRRRWRILKWAGLVVSLLIVLAWGVSLLWTVGYSRSKWVANPNGVGSYLGFLNTLCLKAGGVECYRLLTAERTLELPAQGYWFASWHEGPVRPRWTPYVQVGSNRIIALVPLWTLLLVFAVPTGVLWYRDRRIPPGHCQNCGYDLTGNISGICPECGEKVDSRDLNAQMYLNHRRRYSEPKGRVSASHGRYSR